MRNTKTTTKADVAISLPMLRTIPQMAKVSGIGENTLSDLINNHEIEHVKIGNRRLVMDSAIIDWYERNKIKVVSE